MMARKAQVMVAKKEEPKPVEPAAAKEGIKGTIHKAKAAPGTTAAPSSTTAGQEPPPDRI